jgi:hypothetical protein
LEVPEDGSELFDQLLAADRFILWKNSISGFGADDLALGFAIVILVLGDAFERRNDVGDVVDGQRSSDYLGRVPVAIAEACYELFADWFAAGMRAGFIAANSPGICRRGR